MLDYALNVAMVLCARANAPAHERVDVCGACMDARGMTDEEPIPGIWRGEIEQLAYRTHWADKVLTF